MGCHGNHALHIAEIRFFLEIKLFFAFSGSQNVFSTNEKMSWGTRLVKLDAGV